MRDRFLPCSARLGPGRHASQQACQDSQCGSCSGQAAREIRGLIAQSVEQADAGSRQVHEAGEAVRHIVGQVDEVTALIAEISTASSEQSRGLQQVDAAVIQLDQVTQQNAALVEESTAAAESLRQQALQLSELVAAFRLRNAAATAA